MGFYDKAAWATIFGLALMLKGGLVLWAYRGGRQPDELKLPMQGPEVAATQLFHTQNAVWFALYSYISMGAGAMLLLWAAMILL